MNIKFRRILYIFFILLFFALIPVILSYAKGYRFDFNRSRLVKTGSLVVNSFPIDAYVSFNDRLQTTNFWGKISSKIKNGLGLRKLSGTTPTIFQHLIPDEYKITVGKENYHPWSKKLSIESEQVTFAEDIFLFLENPEVKNIAKENIIIYQSSPDNGKIAYVTKEQEKWNLKFFDLKDEKSTLLYISSFPIDNISWSFSSKKLFVTGQKNNQKNYLVLDITKPDKIIDLGNLGEKASITLKNIKWDLKNDNLLYNLTGSKLFQIDLVNQKIEHLANLIQKRNSSLTDFLVKKNNIYYIYASQDSTYLAEIEISKEAELNLITQFPFSLDYSFITLQNNFLNILEDKTKTIRIINPEIKALEKSCLIKFFANNIVWSENEKKLLYWDDFEIGIFTLEPENEIQPYKKEVLSRYSQLIKKAFWYLENKYIIFELDNNLYAIELDSRDKRNNYSLIKFDELKEITPSEKNGIIYVVGKLNKEEGIFRVKIQ